jgi:transposase InsO family protein
VEFLPDSGDNRREQENHEPTTPAEPLTGLQGRYLDFYNRRRPHSSLDDRTPDQAYFDLPPLRAAA